MKTILLALLCFVKTMKGGKSGPGKYCYFLLPNNRIIRSMLSFQHHVGSKDDRTCI